jgi:hypothetical protein
MKIPKTIRIFGHTFKVKLTKEDGGDFSWKTKIISVGGKFEEQESIFLHEVMEAILCELHYRFYGQESNMPYQFIFDHEGLCKFHKALYQVLKDNKLI